MKRIGILLLFLPIAVFSQGVHFEKELSWKQILQKATNEHKYILVDCYATWCGPCKAMEADVYNDRKVGKITDDKFISVKLQQDSTLTDPPEVKARYADAHLVLSNYQVTAYPTFLFFAPDGKLVHKSFGYKSTEEFSRLLTDASDPKKQYYTLVANYFMGQRDYGNMKNLINMALYLGKRDTAKIIATDYKSHVIDKLSWKELRTKENIGFLINFIGLFHSTDLFFKLCVSEPALIDSLAGRKNYSGDVVNYIISSEEIWDKLIRNNKPVLFQPDWDAISTAITTKYGVIYTNALVPGAQLKFYKFTKDWEAFIALRDKSIKDNPPVAGGNIFSPNSTWNLNSDAWDIFQSTGNAVFLKKALGWIDLAIRLDQPKPNVQYLDTRANVLFRLGRVQEAIDQEQQAVDIMNDVAVRSGKTKGGVFVEDYEKTILKMKNNEPTWPSSKQ